MKLARSTLQHLRLPFSLLLMPVFGLSLSELFSHPSADELSSARLVTAFILLHVFVYPASNGYNSWCDRDEGPIGGILKPLPVTVELRNVSLALDAAALLLALTLIGPLWTLGLALYIAASRAYSHPAIRLKARPFAGWLTVAFFQGAWIVGLVFWAGLPSGQPSENFYRVALGASLLFGGGYPITQIYQHEEDRLRGDLTLSRFLAVRGTLIFTFLCSGIGASLLVLNWAFQSDWLSPALFLTGALPGGILLTRFARKSFKNIKYAHSGAQVAKEVHRLSFWLAMGLNLAFFASALLRTLE